ncbi:MAG TPA: FGGY family carbohydrate kinase, partial [Pirellulaceae bacterium]|nr:FGGY family carbohydrate kinase [Pirellulaceae bacterium]
MSFVLALDEGTTSARAILFDRAGQIHAVAQQEFTQFFPQSGWVEHDAHEIWQAQRAVAEQVLKQAQLTARDIAAIGITNQRETTVLWDRATGEPIAHALVWQDRRTAPLCEQLIAAGHADLVQQRTGLLIDAYFSGTKIVWLLDNIPHARERAERGELAFGTIDTWLLWKLTGGRVHITDASNAARTMLLNIHTGAWDDELLKIMNIPRSVLPEVRSSSEVYAEVSDLPALTGVPIAGIAGDQQAALFGQLCLS